MCHLRNKINWMSYGQMVLTLWDFQGIITYDSFGRERVIDILAGCVERGEMEE